jgi:hypothetical protein
MNRLLEPAWALLLTLNVAVAAAQTAPAVTPPAAPPAKSSAQIDAGEPRAITSPAEPDATPTAGASAAGAPPVGSPSAGSPTAGSPAAGSSAAASAARAHAATSAARAAAPAARSAAGNGQKGAAAVDRLDLGTATVTGDQEQPKVMYVVPWKKSDIGDLSGKPMNSLLDEALAPVDRDEFKREVAYYDAVRADTSQSGASPASKQGEK